MARILGLDLGTNSIGWALIDDELQKIVGMGSRIFPMGVENLGEGDNEISRNAARTGARNIRRQFFRRRLRKQLLLKVLADHNMCPIEAGDFKNWKETKRFPTEKLTAWFALNPYALRHKALTEKITLEEIGRICYHFIQRRGFLSNSRKGGKDDGAIFKGNIKEGKIGITETAERIGDTTLGSYLYQLYPKENEPFQFGVERIRNRYTTRKMYTDEFEQLWSKQEHYHQGLTESLKTVLGGRKQDGYPEDGVLFYQRPLRSQKHLVGNCNFEPSKTKCPISAIPFELFRVYQWVNTVEYNGTKLSEAERNIMVGQLLASEKTEFKKLRKAIGKESAEYKFNYKDDDKIVGSHTISNLSHKKFFGKKWFELSEKEQEDIWHVIYFFDSKSNVREYAITKWGFTDDQAKAIANFNVKDGYASLSRKAIQNIVPFLQQGYPYDVAVVMGGIKNAFSEQWQSGSETDKKKQLELIDNVEAIVRSGIRGGFIDTIKELLRNDFGLEDKQLKKLYHHSATVNPKQQLATLPLGKEADKAIKAIRNPIVITAMFELRRLVNELLNEHGPIDEIKVEMGRDLKSSKSKRNQIRREQKRLERENDRVKAAVEKITKVTPDSVLKYKLWEECKKTCPYTGVPIPVHKLFTGEIQIEHIHPWSRSLNDSFSNKTLCWADENRKKGDKTPYEFYGNDAANWSAVKERALKLFSYTKEYPEAYQKFKRFVQQNLDADFITRQLNDTRFISKEAKDYLMQICRKVTVSPGQMTANLRQKWGLNTVLNDANVKSREDHRHHALDALVLACGKMSYLQELSKWNRYDRSYELKAFPMPWPTFRYDAEKAVENILVSYKQSSGVVTVKTSHTEKNGKVYRNTGLAARGPLHKETVYGKRKVNGEEAFHVRKPIDSLTTEKQLGKIADRTIRELIDKRIQQLGGFEKGNIPANTFFVTDAEGRKQPQIFLPNKNGAPVPVLRVRMRETLNKARQLKSEENQYVNPGNNDHIVVYESHDGKLDKEVVSLWEVVERKKQGLSRVILPATGKRIVQTFKENEMFVLFRDEAGIDWNNGNLNDLSDTIYKVQKIAGADYFLEICFRKHNDARSDKEAKADYVYIKGFGDGKTGWHTIKPIKITVSATGKIQKK